MAEAAVGYSSSHIPPSSTHYTYHVFLSFRGKDTRYSFTDHLYTALRDRGIETFRDADELRKGEEISPALVKAIEESRVSLIVFSENYASSRWCLDELVKIMECRESGGQEVRPVFYKVEPSDVRHQIGAFGDAFAKLDQGRHKDSMGKWREALKEAANLSGWTLKESEYEAKFIKTIIEELSAQVINPSSLLEVAAHPIGLESSRTDVTKLLGVGENIVRMVGIWGPGGIGKTTIAKAVFNSISHRFEGSCFLADVRSKSSSTSDGLTQLQETILDDILRDSTLKVRSVDQGIRFIRTRMKGKKVLLILDDVSDSSQLENLVPSLDCFGPGSRIIITTRDKHSLTAHGVDEVYDVRMLDGDHSMKLFSLSAFKRIGPPDEYLKLARCAVSYAGGLPLALTLLGSHLYHRSIDEWEATLDSCKGGDPQIKIRNILKISYDALGEDFRNYFLDIACFFKSKYVRDVKPILEACYDLKPATAGIRQLEQKALIRIEEDDDKIWMHDLIEEMGKDIVYQESPDESGGRSRLWCEDDVDRVLTNNTGTNNIKGIQIACRSVKDWNNGKSFSVMKKLRYLSIQGLVCEESEVDYLFQELRCLDLPDCWLHSFPSGFHANKLVKLNISNSNITRLWDGGQIFPRLTSMNLSNCYSLAQLPDFSRIPNLKELDLSHCFSLVEVPDSVGFLDKLVTLTVFGCSKLIRLPRIINLKSAKSISITNCKKLEEFSEVGEEMCSLTSLDLSSTGIRELHPSIAKLIGLEELNLRCCKNLSTIPDFSRIPNLKELDLAGCKSLVEVPDSVGLLDKLVTLRVEGCDELIRLPRIINLKSAKSISITACFKLEEFSEVGEEMCSLTSLYLSSTGIRELHPSIAKLIGLEELSLSECENLTSLPHNISVLGNLKSLNVGFCPKLAMSPKFPVQMNSLRELELGGSDMRECLDESIGNLIGLECLDLSWCENLTSLPCSIYGLQHLKKLRLGFCSKLVRFPTNTNILNDDGCSLSLPNLKELMLSGCTSLSDCDFLTTLDCCQTLEILLLSGTNVVSLPACFTKFVNLREFSFVGCKSLRELPELPPNIDGCKSLERCPDLSKFGYESEEEEASTEEEPTSSSESGKRHRTAEEPSTVAE